MLSLRGVASRLGLLQVDSEDMPADVAPVPHSALSRDGSSSDGDISVLTTEQKQEMRDYLAAEAAKLEAEARRGELLTACMLLHP